MVSKQQAYELEDLLYDVLEKGYAVVSLRKLYRLLDKGNRSAGTWKALLDAWEEIGPERRRDELYIYETHREDIVISIHKTDSLMRWAGE